MRHFSRVVLMSVCFVVVVVVVERTGGVLPESAWEKSHAIVPVLVFRYIRY